MAQARAKFYFSDVVVVDDFRIGCVVKSWFNDKTGYSYEVYVRNYTRVDEYAEEDLKRYVVSKELSEEETSWH